MDRRQFLLGSTSTAAAALFVGRVAPGYAQAAGGLSPTDHWGTPRASTLQRGRLLAHADLHNHTRFSDGDGEALHAFEWMRGNNLDVACITDHTSGERLLAAAHDLGQASGCGCGDVDAISMSDAEWDRLRELADQHDDPAGGFIAMRGFEWSASVPETGHMNVWLSADWTDPVDGRDVSVAPPRPGHAGGRRRIRARTTRPARAEAEATVRRAAATPPGGRDVS